MILYHYTDKKGAEAIKKSGVIGTDENEKIYLTTVPPDKVKPLMNENDAKDFEALIRGKKFGLLRKYQLILLFKWRHKVVRKFGNMVPVGEHKLKYCFKLKVKNNKVLMKDKYGEIYAMKPIKLKSDPDYTVQNIP